MRAVLLALAFVSALPGMVAAAPLEAYGGLPSIETIEISPDGANLATIVSNGERRGIIVRSTAGGPSRTFGVGDTKVRRLDWATPQHLIITTSQTSSIAGATGPRREYAQAFDLDLSTGKMRPLLQKPIGRPTTGTNLRDKDTGKVGATLNIIIGPPDVRMVAGAPALFVKGISFPGDRGVLTVFQIDLKSGDPHLTEIGDRYTNDILLGQDGAPLAKTEYDEQSGRWSLRLRQGAGWRDNRVVQSTQETPYIVGLGRDGRSVVVAEMGETGMLVREVSPEGVWSEPLDVKEADGSIFDPQTHRLIGLYALVGDEDRYVFFDPVDQKAWNSVRAAFKGDRVRLESWSSDRKKIVVVVDSATEGTAYALVDLTTKQASWIGARYQKLAEADVAKVQPVAFKAKDGMALTGYLTLPNGLAAKNLPLVVFPHGGPASRDEPGFDWWAQAMASRGYAVLQVNFRGSDGFGYGFVKAGFGEWGRKMQTDLSDGVRHLAAQGTIDPKRVCIVGGSYGGYAALAGAALDTGVYRCAASVGGLSDLRRFVDWSKSHNGLDAFRYWTRFMGAEASRDPALGEISPALHVDRVSIPVLLVHGRDDTVVPLEQSQIMAEALKKAGKPVELVVQKGADHWLSQGATRLETLQAVTTFLETHNPPGAGGS